MLPPLRGGAGGEPVRGAARAEPLFRQLAGAAAALLAGDEELTADELARLKEAIDGPAAGQTPDTHRGASDTKGGA